MASSQEQRGSRRIELRLPEHVCTAAEAIAAEMGWPRRGAVQAVLVMAVNQTIRRYRPATGGKLEQRDPYEGMVCIEPLCSGERGEVPFRQCKDKQRHEPLSRGGA